MAKRRITYYEMHDDDDYKGRFQLSFRTFRAALRALKRFGEGYTLYRLSERDPNEYRLILRTWFVDEKGKIVDRRHTWTRRVELRRRKQRRSKLFYQGKLYVPPEPEDLPF
jgi:hypothetical protein